MKLLKTVFLITTSSTLVSADDGFGGNTDGLQPEFPGFSKLASTCGPVVWKHNACHEQQSQDDVWKCLCEDKGFLRDMSCCVGSPHLPGGGDQEVLELAKTFIDRCPNHAGYTPMMLDWAHFRCEGRHRDEVSYKLALQDEHVPPEEPEQQRLASKESATSDSGSVMRPSDSAFERYILRRSSTKGIHPDLSWMPTRARICGENYWIHNGCHKSHDQEELWECMCHDKGWVKDTGCCDSALSGTVKTAGTTRGFLMTDSAVAAYAKMMSEKCPNRAYGDLYDWGSDAGKCQNIWWDMKEIPALRKQLRELTGYAPPAPPTEHRIAPRGLPLSSTPGTTELQPYEKRAESSTPGTIRLRPRYKAPGSTPGVTLGKDPDFSDMPDVMRECAFTYWTHNGCHKQATPHAVARCICDDKGWLRDTACCASDVKLGGSQELTRQFADMMEEKCGDRKATDIIVWGDDECYNDYAGDIAEKLGIFYGEKFVPTGPKQRRMDTGGVNPDFSDMPVVMKVCAREYWYHNSCHEQKTQKGVWDCLCHDKGWLKDASCCASDEEIGGGTQLMRDFADMMAERCPNRKASEIMDWADDDCKMDYRHDIKEGLRFEESASVKELLRSGH
ncbi:hypothetical protein NA57DRAFT_81765 [Rhizodiscina lignyota]|uniref:Uncharacterized protein n=1 Tax=Rhizodiscina lignyota TaxID=1504668 RepID=A0A9P4M3B1_9PEZI|nr:hypothetical protein NA57DRAFT_81765 [Rhizodiscina lignyota]